MANGTWKIARKGNTQLPLLIVLALAVVLVLVGRAESGLFDRARTAIIDGIEPVLTAVHRPVALFDRWLGSAAELFDVYRENLRLKEENARLRQWRNVAVVMEDRASRYQALLHAVSGRSTHSVLARVIGRAGRPFLQTMILNAGSADGVKPGEAVVDAHGMIGRIYLTGHHTSWVILLTDLNSRIPVATAPGGHQAMMVGDNTRMPVLDTMSAMGGLHPGDQVFSSGDGGLLPPGLPIGTVTLDQGRFRVALLADAGSSEDVEVLGFREPPEILPAATNDQLPAVAAGLAPAAPAPTPAPVSAAQSPAAPGKPKAATLHTDKAQVSNAHAAAIAGAEGAATAPTVQARQGPPSSAPDGAQTSAGEPDQGR